MKRISAFILVFVIMLSFIINAFSVDIDGISNGNEWHDATAYVLVDGESNCNINFGAVMVKFDNENSCVYMCFSFIDPELETDNPDCGVKISVNGSRFFVVDASSSPLNEEIDRYSFDGAVSSNEVSGGVCEVRVGFKEGLPRQIDCDVQLIDSKGEPSNHYNLSLINEGYTETTALEIMPTHDNSDPYYNPDLLTEKSTTEKTTKKKTTKPTTEKETTRKKKTTTTLPPTTKFVVPDSPMCYTGRTKTTKSAQTVIVEKEEVKLVTVYYYEKEVIISHVPVTVLVTEEIKQESTDIITENSSAEVTIVEDTTETNPTVKSISDGSKYKKYLIAAGGIGFGLIAFIGVMYFRKSNTNI